MMLSVIIPTYNRKGLIKYTLDSLDKQHHPEVDFEIIVVDDGSDDGTYEYVINNYPNVTLVKNIQKGAPSARNAGVSIAKGKYIMYLDSDDLVGPRFFKQKISFLEQNPGIQACYGEYDFFESDNDFRSEYIIYKIKYPIIQSTESGLRHLSNYLSGYYLPPNAIIWRKEFVDSIGGYDESLSINQDVELFIRAILNGLKIVPVIDDTKVYIRSHTLDKRVGSTGDSDKKYLEILELRKRIISEMKMKNINDALCLQSLSHYLFNFWIDLRKSKPEIAAQFLSLAQKTYWPIQLKGGIFLRLLSQIVGPVNAIKIKGMMR